MVGQWAYWVRPTQLCLVQSYCVLSLCLGQEESFFFRRRGEARLLRGAVRRLSFENHVEKEKFRLILDVERDAPLVVDAETDGKLVVALLSVVVGLVCG